MHFAVANLRDNENTQRWQFAVASGILGWVLDAFDFFVLVFLFDTLAAHFNVKKVAIVYTLTLTLAMRPVGALLFGALADRFGRKKPLILCVLYFSVITVLSGFAPRPHCRAGVDLRFEVWLKLRKVFRVVERNQLLRHLELLPEVLVGCELAH
jgi:hypothetical protein